MKVSFNGRALIGPVMLAGLFASSNAFPAVILDGLFNNPGFASNQPVNVGDVVGCPTGWTCSGSPTPGFTSYTVTANEYAGAFTPLGVGARAASSPTVVEGRGDIFQSGLGGLTYVAGQTYTVNLWVGTPNNVPAIGGVAAGTPAGKVGVITVYFTGAPGVALGDGAFNGTPPSPGTWTLETFNFTPSAADLGKPVGLDIHVDSTQPGGGSGNNDIANFQIATVVPEPASLLLGGLGIAGLGLLGRRRRAAK